MEVQMRIKTKDEAVLKYLKDKYENLKEENILSATLSILYFNKKSAQVIQVKMNHQLNSMETAIHQINPKFQEKSKNYAKIEEEMITSLDAYERVLKQLANRYDEKLKELIFQKLKLETKLLIAILTKQYLYQKEMKHKKVSSVIKSVGSVIEKVKSKVNPKEQVDVGFIHRIEDQKQIEQELKEDSIQSDEYKQNRKLIIKLEKEIKLLNKKMQKLDTEKVNKIFEAMEVGNKELTINLKKPRKLSKITKFFTNRFHTYNVIMKTVINPLNQRIEECKANELKKANLKIKDLDLKDIQNKLKSIQENELEDKLIIKNWK